MRIFIAGFLLLSNLISPRASVKPAIADAVKDKFTLPVFHGENPDSKDYMGSRMQINLEKRLLTINLASLLEPYKNRPGKQTWIGEHVGKYLHAAALTWEFTGSAALKARMDSAARELMSTQTPDGYLGTYAEKDRWTDWDVWSHKYNLVGLLAYYNVTGNEQALNACKKIGNLLINTFQKGDKDIIKASWHVGMASTSVLEPMVMLYRYTADKKYLEFCRFIINEWDKENGPKILKGLLEHGSVFKTANGKAYEMLSNLVGLIDLYRITGEEQYFKACTNAWNDIRTNRHYIIGTTSWGEHFREDNILRAEGEVHGDKFEGPGEGCVTVTWQQLNMHLLRLSGETKYADELEQLTYNSLLGAQSPQDGTVCYFVPLEGRKRFAEVNHGILPDISCCASSIPRGVALIPFYTAGAYSNGAAVFQYVSGNYPVSVKSGKITIAAEFEIASLYPEKGNVSIRINLPGKAAAKSFPIGLRVPDWCKNFKALIGGQSLQGKGGEMLTVNRPWKTGDEIKIEMSLDLQVIPSGVLAEEKIAIKRGPQVLAADDMIDTFNRLPNNWVGDQFYLIKSKIKEQEMVYRMVPFAEAGQTKGHYSVFLTKGIEVDYKK